MSAFREKEKQINEKVNKKIKTILPVFNIILLSLIMLVFLNTPIGIFETILFIALQVLLNYKVVGNWLKEKEILANDYIYNEIIPEVFNKYFDDYKIDKEKGITLEKAKKSDLLSIKYQNIFEEEDYVKFHIKDEEFEMSDVQNIRHTAESYTTTAEHDFGILIKQNTEKLPFKFVIRDFGKFDYKKEYFEEEQIDLFETGNEEFEKNYTCYTNDPVKFKTYLTKERINKLLKYQKENNRVEISHNDKELFILINETELNFNLVYNKEGELQIEEIEKNANNSLLLVNKVINDFKI